MTGISILTKAKLGTSKVMDATSSTRRWLSWATHRDVGADGHGEVEKNRFDVEAIAAEEALKLVHQLFLRGKEPLKIVAFTGYDHGKGTSGICAQTVRALSSLTSGSICLVEAKLRSPSISPGRAASTQSGFAACLSREGPIRTFATSIYEDNVWLLSGCTNPADVNRIWRSERLQQRMLELRNSFDYVIVDAPPLNGGSAALMVGRHTDGLVIVLEAGSARREASIRAAEQVRAAGIPLLGAVLDKRTFPIPESLYRRL
jgi:Mrp family chromosome partitioning ATPase